MNQAWDLECPVKQLDSSQRRQLDLASERLIPEAFQGLISTGRPILFEVACGPDSVLTSKMQQMTGKTESARRFAYWNGYDLSTSTGVRAVIAAIDRDDPLNVWLSLECGPFSRMQNVNQRTPEQREVLKEKRANVIKQYVGGLLVYVHCYQKGIPVTWEWSETCDAWRLPMVQRVFEKYPPMFCVVKGCRVNLRDPKTNKPLSKGWKLGTTHLWIHERMTLPCRCQEKAHAPCQGRLTRESAYYTDDFARRVCRAILEEIGSRELHEELIGHAGVPVFRLGRPVECSCEEVTHPRSSLRCNCCEMTKEKENPLSLAGEVEEAPMGELTPEEHERAMKQISLIHRNTGHGPIENLVRALESRRADPRIVSLAKSYRCPICEETKRQVPRPRVSLEPLPPKWNTIQADTALWKHPGTGERCQFAIIIDEGCRFRVGRVMSRGSGFGVSARSLLSFFQESWKPIFGVPSKIRLDPAGAWRSKEMSDYWNTLGVELDTIPAEAHWQLSYAERAIQCTKQMMDKIVSHDPEVTCEEALSEAIRIENEREVVRGYSPAQHALGRAPDESGRFHNSGILGIPPQLCENGEGEFERNSDRMRVAEKAFSDWTHNDRLNRARNTRSYQVKMFSPGDLVFVWRIQGSGQKHGGFTGPARVLAMETRVSEDGTSYRPGSVVWLVRGSRLIKAAPEQLRKASVREECQEVLCNPPSLPWTLTKMMDEVGERQYDDVSGEIPEPMEFERAVDEEVNRPFKRVRYKRDVPECPPPIVEEVEMDDGDLFGEHELHDTFQDSYAECFWGQTGAAVELSFEVPETKRGKQNFVENLSSFLASNLKRRTVEVSERNMNEEELHRMRDAKQEEIRKFLSAEALQVLPKHLQPDKQTAMKMRWVLTWKRDETTGDRKAKARCVILGYMDPQYAHRQVAAPTMSRTTRQLFLAISASLGFRVEKGDVSGAFLQGRSYKGEAFVIPTDDMCDSMGIPPNSVTKLKKACYGLVDAPLEWFLTVSDFLTSIGFSRCVCDPCCFKYVKDGVLIGLITGHVDDFLFSGSKDCKLWDDLCKKVKERFKWGTWESGSFTQCGVHIKTMLDGGFELSQTQYVDDVQEIQISSERRRNVDSETNDREKSKLRAALGALSWCAQQTYPQIAAGVSLLLSQVTKSTVRTMIETNKLVFKLKSQRKHRLLIHGNIPIHDILVAGWSDAAVQNRVDGKSTQGLFVGITSRALLEGSMCKISPIAWQSAKINRQCRSPGAAECLAAIDCEDLMYSVRLQFYEMCGNVVQVRHTGQQVALIPGVLVTDSTNVHDRMKTEVYVPKGPENRTALEMLGLKEALTQTKTPIRWVNSDAQLANSLTKDHEQHQLQRFYHLGQCWRIVEDPTMKSARNRKKLGVDPLQNFEDTQEEEPTMSQETILKQPSRENLSPRDRGMLVDNFVP